MNNQVADGDFFVASANLMSFLWLNFINKLHLFALPGEKRSSIGHVRLSLTTLIKLLRVQALWNDSYLRDKDLDFLFLWLKQSLLVLLISFLKLFKMLLHSSARSDFILISSSACWHERNIYLAWLQLSFFNTIFFYPHFWAVQVVHPSLSSKPIKEL